MQPILLLVLVSSAFAVKLIEIFDCGPQNSKFQMTLAKTTLKQCPLVQDSFNMCCKDHDYCYSVHALHNFTQEHCDARFCGCLHDAEDINNNDVCDLQQKTFCRSVTDFGGVVFRKSVPESLTATFEKFEDGKPFGLEMKKLVDACEDVKSMAVHCHNTAYRCLEKRNKRNGTMAQHSHEDCESIMYECLQIIGESKDTDSCPLFARTMAKKLTGKLSVERYGRAAIEIYPVISKRLFDSCENRHPSLMSCMRTFDRCASDPVNREEHPEDFNAARRIKIGCHQRLRECIDKETTDVNDDKCEEARNLALSRIREHPYEKKMSTGDFVKEQWGSVTNCVMHPWECTKAMASGLWDFITSPFQ